MQQLELYHIGFLGLAIVLEIVANIFLKMSDGFRKIWLGLLSLLSVLGAFSALAQAVKGIDLSVAYALWGVRYCRDNRRRLDPVRSAPECQRLDWFGVVAGRYGDHQAGLSSR